MLKQDRQSHYNVLSTCKTEILALPNIHSFTSNHNANTETNPDYDLNILWTSYIHWISSNITYVHFACMWSMH